MGTTVIRKHIGYLVQARQQRAADPLSRESAQLKERAIRQSIQYLRKLPLKRRMLALTRLVQEADVLDEPLNCALEGTADA
jgi:hypothetical protein